MLFGTAKRLYSQSNLKVSLKEHLINFVSGYKYLGVSLDPSLNMNDHLQKILKNVAVRIRLLKRMRYSLSDFAAESVYEAIVLPKILYCSTPVLKVSDTMANKFERLQRSAIKIIHKQPKSCKECGLMTIQNQKKFKAAIQIFQMFARDCHPKSCRIYRESGSQVQHKRKFINAPPSKGQNRGCKKIISFSRSFLL